MTDPQVRSNESGIPADWEKRYRTMVLVDRASDSRIGFFLAYYRTFATPESADVLVKSGEILRRPEKRSYDTALILMEIIANGFDSERGIAALNILNRAHTYVKAADEDFLYILLSLLVVPARWLENHGSSPMNSLECASATRFYQELGKRMNLSSIPDSYDDAVRFYDEFETRRVVPSDSSFMLMDATVDVLAARFPRALRPLTRAVLSVLIDDPRMSRALGLAPSSRPLRWLVFTGVAIQRKLPRRRKPAFTPGRSGSSVYPDGYTMEDLGPAR